MNLHQLYEPRNLDHVHFPEPLELRGELIDRLKDRAAVWDVLVVGGGIHGASFARLAAVNGLRTLLVEREDYSAATSSRSSKLAHGGVRYLELLDFKQVFEGIKARESLFASSAHLVHPTEFLFPVRSRNWFARTKIGFGLSLYDLFMKDRSRRHRFIDRVEVTRSSPLAWGGESGGGFIYSDGIMRDGRLVIETIVAARQEGALCLNYLSLDSVMHQQNGRVIAGWTDRLTGERGEVEAGIVVNCGGPWAPHLGRITANSSAPVVYSQGSHILFDVPWKGPSLIVPRSERARYYFVCPHPGGTLVGTTERVVESPDADPFPRADELGELFDLLARDVPSAGLNRETAYYAFAGTRILPLRGRAGASSSKLSRKHVWSYSNGVLSLYGGKYTTAVWTAFEGLKKVFELSGITREPSGIADRLLPGAASLAPSIAAFTERCRVLGIDEALVAHAVDRFGARVRHFDEERGDFEVLGGRCFRGEARLALDVEQSERLSDLMRRRLELEFLPGNGMEAVDAVAGVLKTARPGVDEGAEADEYRRRIERVRAVLKG